MTTLERLLNKIVILEGASGRPIESGLERQGHPKKRGVIRLHPGQAKHAKAPDVDLTPFQRTYY